MLSFPMHKVQLLIISLLEFDYFYVIRHVTMETDLPLTKVNPLTKQGRIKFWGTKIWQNSNQSAENVKIKGKHSFPSYCSIYAYAKRDPLDRWSFHWCYYYDSSHTHPYRKHDGLSGWGNRRRLGDSPFSLALSLWQELRERERE